MSDWYGTSSALARSLTRATRIRHIADHILAVEGPVADEAGVETEAVEPCH